VRHLDHPCFAHVPASFTAVRYHSLSATRLPDDLVETAWCLDGGRRVTMAVAHRSKPMWGVQFHPESILTEHGARLISNVSSLDA
jgi:anthranilate/para-aminobenzoate synthase component II